ncbi:hypothetical protein M5I08_18660 [Candidatus Mycobacterium methanotrophicum]|uniref:Uncharacterized protein n=1 Tax=Candidatus Mycobacterium methanotrophicum TaxID=2943498 RepID=A0ABY4QRD1_9MYCO|nr:hypothetical protein [Candidatus Mycobacterium methanotrophicum]UQX13211.1 hypothetical protein M5I08_18660 [Candidatus Mycobacterium methanotrophicum]
MLQQTLQDVADLAKVRRPVVSMWRKRPIVRGVSIPFPAPVEITDGVARFARDEVVEWLTRTGRGNNAEHAYDAPAVAVPDGVALEDVVTLLCWHVLTGQELAGTSLPHRVGLAEEFDPDDLSLLREIRGVQASEALLTYVDDLVEASFGPPDALARLEQGRLKRTLGARELTRAAVEMLGWIVEAAATHLEHEPVVMRADDWVALDIAAACELGVVSNDRALRRRAVIRGIAVGEPAARPRISVSSLVGLDIGDALDRADDVVVALDEDDVAVLLGPAAALSDELAATLQQRRATTLRVGNLVAAIRLPRGLWREAHRQSLALWICLGGANAQRPWVADLGVVDHLERGDIAADIAGALAQTEDRAFRYARRIDLASVLAAGSVVPRGVRAPTLREADPARHLERVHAATLTTTSPLEPLDVLVEPSPGRFRLLYRSLGELHERKHLIVKRGSRIDFADASPDGTVPVLPAEMARRVALDPIDAARKYPRAARTDPGDVIFIEKPRPRAWVDPVGGAMVASPARIIRLQESAEIGPTVLATVINEMAAVGSEWKTWTVPAMRRDEAARLEAALMRADEFEREARRRADAARDLKTALINGVAAGALTLDAQPTTPGVAAAER